MLVSIRAHDAVSTVVTATGELHLGHTDDVKTAILLALAGGSSDVTLDLTGITGLDSVGLGAVACAHEYVLARGGTFRVRCAEPAAQLLATSGLDQLFPVVLGPGS
jgi:anti-sigma B factor antagonist